MVFNILIFKFIKERNIWLNLSFSNPSIYLYFKLLLFDLAEFIVIILKAAAFETTFYEKKQFNPKFRRIERI